MVQHNTVTKNSYRSREQEMTHLNVNCYISDMGHFIETYIVISVYKNYQILQCLSCIETAVVSVSLTEINRIHMFCWARQFSLRMCNNSQGFKNCHPRIHLMTLKKKAVSINKSRFLSVVRSGVDRRQKDNLVPWINIDNKFDMQAVSKPLNST